MNRLGFLKRLGALVASTLVVPPLLEALAADGPCNMGLIWHIEHSGKVDVYTPLTQEMLDKLIEDLKASDYDFTLNPRLYE